MGIEENVIEKLKLLPSKNDPILREKYDIFTLI